MTEINLELLAHENGHILIAEKVGAGIALSADLERLAGLVANMHRWQSAAIPDMIVIYMGAVVDMATSIADNIYKYNVERAGAASQLGVKLRAYARAIAECIRLDPEYARIQKRDELVAAGIARNAERIIAEAIAIGE